MVTNKNRSVYVYDPLHYSLEIELSDLCMLTATAVFSLSLAWSGAQPWSVHHWFQLT